MVEKRKLVHFKVHWQVLGKTEKNTRDWLLNDLPELMRMLWKEETLRPADCEFMYIHQIAGGTTKEVLAYEKPKDKLPTVVQGTHQKGRYADRPVLPADKVVEAVKEVIQFRIHGTNRYAFMEAK